MSTETPNMPTSDSKFVIADVLSFLITRSGESLRTISEQTGINYKTLHSIKQRASSGVNLKTLKSLADFFNEDITIFLGLDNYEKPLHLSDREKALVETYRKLNDEAQGRVDQMARDYVDMKKYRREGH